MSLREGETGADRSGSGENGLGGDLEDYFHTTMAFSQDQFSTNQLLLCVPFLNLSPSDKQQIV